MNAYEKIRACIYHPNIAKEDQALAALAELEKAAAELEQAVVIRDTEIARLEADLELARRDVVRLKTKVNATFDAIKEHAPRTVTRRIFASMHEAIDAARAGNWGEG